MAFCTKCGTQFEAGTAFCGNCGTAVAAAATLGMKSPDSQPSGREVPVSNASALSTTIATPKKHVLPSTSQPSPMTPLKTMAERVAQSVFMFAIGVPIMFIVFIAINWAVEGSLIIAIPRGWQLRLSILIAAFSACKTMFDD
jgi:hypothetical protein